jgi:hypothetical protein
MELWAQSPDCDSLSVLAAGEPSPSAPTRLPTCPPDSLLSCPSAPCVPAYAWSGTPLAVGLYSPSPLEGGMRTKNQALPPRLQCPAQPLLLCRPGIA